MSPAAISPLTLPLAGAAARQISPWRGSHTLRQSQSVGINVLPTILFTFHSSSDQPHHIPSVDSGLGKFGAPHSETVLDRDSLGKFVTPARQSHLLG